MIRNTFCHLPGISSKAELELWERGIASWQELICQERAIFSPGRRKSLEPHITRSLEHLEKANPAYFAQLLTTHEHWRLFNYFRSKTAYLDIETTGLGAPGDHITTIVIYDGLQVRHYIHGQNLDAFRQDISQYAVIVTFNGKCFDLPFIERALGFRLPQVHIDLRYVMKDLGYRGGLKAIEKRLGMGRDDLDGVDGFLAVLLWREYRRGCREALETLLAYNVQDVLNLEVLMVQSYNMKLKGTPFTNGHVLEHGRMPANPFRANRAVIERCLRGRDR